MFNHQDGEYLTCEDAQIYYEIKSKNNAPILLLLHGGVGTIEDFNPIMPFLIHHFHVIGIDSRGHGKSTLGNNLQLTYERLSKDVLQVLSHLHIKQCHLFGFSDGGTVAYRLATDQNIEISSIVTIGSGWRVDNSSETKTLFQQLSEDFWKEKYPSMYEDYQDLNPNPDFGLLIKLLVEMWLDEEQKSGYPNTKIKEIQSKTLVIRGEHDYLFAINEALDLIQLLPNAHFMNVPFASHEVIKEQPDLLQKALTLFFQ